MILTPVFDNVHFGNLEVEPRGSAANGFDWAMWCLYDYFRPEWYDAEDDSLPAK